MAKQKLRLPRTPLPWLIGLVALFSMVPEGSVLDWGAHTVDLCQWANNADDTMPIDYEPSANNITANYANGVKLVLDFLETPFGERPGWIQHLGTCPVRFVGRRSAQLGEHLARH